MRKIRNLYVTSLRPPILKNSFRFENERLGFSEGFLACDNLFRTVTGSQRFPFKAKQWV